MQEKPKSYGREILLQNNFRYSTVGHFQQWIRKTMPVASALVQLTSVWKCKMPNGPRGRHCGQFLHHRQLYLSNFLFLDRPQKLTSTVERQWLFWASTMSNRSYERFAYLEQRKTDLPFNINETASIKIIVCCQSLQPVSGASISWIFPQTCQGFKLVIAKITMEWKAKVEVNRLEPDSYMNKIYCFSVFV